MRIANRLNKAKGKIVISLVTILLLTMTMFTIAKASNSNEDNTQTNNNLETMTYVDRNEHIRNIVKAICNSDNNYILNNTYLFTEDVYDDLLKYTENNNINSNDIGDTVIDSVDVKNSDTGDYVIMANTKIWYEDQQYNKLYLFEFHVNYEGRIYGYNVWVY